MTAAPIRVAIVGMGKIARDQHLPAIDTAAELSLAATVSPHDDGVAGVPHYRTLNALLREGPRIDAVALCTPPQVRYALATEAIANGVHVFLEKPPGATLSEVAALKRLAEAAPVTLFASWHSRFAAGVEPARAWLAGRTVERASIVWREDARVWHPAQEWIWQPGGLGVFDPGINALSIATHILPRPFYLVDALLERPANRAAPIAAALTFRDVAGAAITADLDWRQTGPQTWDIIVETDGGVLRLSEGGANLSVPGAAHCATDYEYAGLYARFTSLVRAGLSEVDVAPLRLVADAFLCGRTKTVEPFHD